jgi:hypothetical protein
MIKKAIATLSLVLPLAAAAAATAHAGATITEKNYWPSEAKLSQTSGPARSNPKEAFASAVYAPAASAPISVGMDNVGRYQGGPKGR